ncbi:MAG: 2-phospho-L-lactate transferase [Solirubrobacteraceae bacterium]
MSGPVVVLAGGTGGAKLARGMLDVVGGEDLVVIANTGDDIEIYGGYVSPDPDLVTFWLADRIGERGWGLAGDTFAVRDGLVEIGREVWFSLGDRDLAVAVQRAEWLTQGLSLTETQRRIAAALEVQAQVLPMSDQAVRTRVMAGGRWWPFQEFMIRTSGEQDVQDVDYRGARAAAPTPQVLEALGAARAIVIGPSNPVISIGPILAIPGLRRAMAAAAAPVVAVSPLVSGAVVKGPTEPFLRWAGRPLSSAGIASFYEDLVDGLVADEQTDAVPVLLTDVLMDSPSARRRVAEETLTFAQTLGR